MDGATVWWKLHDPNFNRFRLIHPCDRRTDAVADPAMGGQGGPPH